VVSKVAKGLLRRVPWSLLAAIGLSAAKNDPGKEVLSPPLPLLLPLLPDAASSAAAPPPPRELRLAAGFFFSEEEKRLSHPPLRVLTAATGVPLMSLLLLPLPLLLPLLLLIGLLPVKTPAPAAPSPRPSFAANPLLLLLNLPLAAPLRALLLLRRCHHHAAAAASAKRGTMTAAAKLPPARAAGAGVMAAATPAATPPTCATPTLAPSHTMSSAQLLQPLAAASTAREAVHAACRAEALERRAVRAAEVAALSMAGGRVAMN
jgi:hypothetical protein